jgi:hypothetical protein
MTRRLAMMCRMTMFVVAFASPLVQAQVTNPYATSLKGLDTLFVMVEQLPTGARSMGLSEDTLRTDVELKLRLAGIRVVPRTEGVKLPGHPYLYVQVSVTDSAHAASVDVQLNQDVLMVRNDQFVYGATTWNVGTTISNPNVQGIRDSVKDRVDEFLNDWLSVNPKK